MILQVFFPPSGGWTTKVNFVSLGTVPFALQLISEVKRGREWGEHWETRVSQSPRQVREDPDFFSNLLCQPSVLTNVHRFMIFFLILSTKEHCEHTAFFL